MRRALRLAVKGMGWTSPNPLVGAVIVSRNGEVIGQGYHRQFGAPHAEVEAIARCDNKSLKDSTLYVNLEPCCHYGKTPPCTDAIIRAGLKRVVVAMIDPNPIVAGKGIECLRKAGIVVDVGICESEAIELNRAYVKYHTKGSAWCHLKVALSLDGKIADLNGRSKYLTCEKTLRYVHRLRAQNDAVLVGRKTVEVDDPQLNVRLVKGRNPIPLVLTANGKVDFSKKVFNLNTERRAILLCGGRAGNSEIIYHNERVIFPLDRNGRIPPKQILTTLPHYGILSVLVEGGAGVLSSFLKDGAVDELTFTIAPTIIGKGLSPFDEYCLENWDQRPLYRLNKMWRSGTDVILNYRNLGE